MCCFGLTRAWVRCVMFRHASNLEDADMLLVDPNTPSTSPPAPGVPHAGHTQLIATHQRHTCCCACQRQKKSETQQQPALSWGPKFCRLLRFATVQATNLKNTTREKQCQQAERHPQPNLCSCCRIPSHSSSPALGPLYAPCSSCSPYASTASAALG